MKLKKSNTKNIIIASVFGLSLLGLGALPIAASEMTFATTSADLMVEVTVPLYLSITNAASIPSEMTISNSTGYSSSQDVTVSTNNAGGYKLTAKAISTDTESTISNKMLRRDNEGVAVSDTGIQSVAAKTTLGDMSNGYWGLALGAFNVSTSQFRPVATTDAGIIGYSTAPATGTTTVTFGAKADTSFVSGTYSAIIQFTALANDGSAKTLYGD